MTNVNYPTSGNNEVSGITHNAHSLPPVFIGLPMWQHSQWPQTWFAGLPKAQSQLVQYAQECNTVEGNTTFYSLPHADAVERWAASVPEHFSFTFKFSQNITHVHQLKHCEEDVQAQLALLAGLKNKLGLMMVQLPSQFGPQKLNDLERFLTMLPDTISVAVEVRHLDFFAKGEAEKAFNQLLIRNNANRIMMDTRALFTGPCHDTLLKEVREKKPRVPVNVIATGDKPVVRFVGNNNEVDNESCLRPWVTKVHQWRCQGKTPYVFCHRPDNKDAPWLAQLFIDMYNTAFPTTPLPNLSLKVNPTQDALF